MARRMMNRNMLHNDKAQRRDMVSYFAGMVRFFAGFYWYSYFCSRYRRPAETT